MKCCNLGRGNISRSFLLWLSLSVSIPMVFFPWNALAAPAVQLARTGQTSCWDTSGNDTPCEATGQDGETRLGVAWPEPRFADNGDGTITDRLTDLVWLKNADCSGVVTWQQALTAAGTLAAGTCGLADGSAAGEWRLPNRKELLSIMNFQQANGAAWLAGQGFVNGIHGWYWTSDTYAPLPAAKWVVHSVGAAWADNHPQITTRDFHAVYVRDPGVPVLELSPVQAAFGEVEVGRTSPPLPLLLRNSGRAPLIITSIAISGADGGMFGIEPGTGAGGTCGTLSPTIAPGQSCSLSLSFSPVAPGARTATMNLLPQGGGPVAFPLTGTGNRVTYQVVVSTSNEFGSISPDRSEVPEGESATIVVTPAEGYRADTVVGGTCPGGSFTGTTYTTGAITADCTAVISFVPRQFTVSTLANGNGTITCNPADSAAYLTPVSCTAQPAKGDVIRSIVVDGIDQTVADPAIFIHTFGPITADHTIVATFDALPTRSFTVTPLRTEHGTMSPQGPQAAPAGSSLTFSVVPESGYRIVSVTGCRGTLEGSSYITAPVSENCTVTAAFEPLTVAEVLRAFRFAVGKIQLMDQEKQQYDVAPLGAGGKPEPDGIVDVADVVIMLRRLSGLVAW